MALHGAAAVREARPVLHREGGLAVPDAHHVPPEHGADRRVQCGPGYRTTVGTVSFARAARFGDRGLLADAQFAAEHLGEYAGRVAVGHRLQPFVHRPGERQFDCVGPILRVGHGSRIARPEKTGSAPPVRAATTPTPEIYTTHATLSPNPCTAPFGTRVGSENAVYPQWCTRK